MASTTSGAVTTVPFSVVIRHGRPSPSPVARECSKIQTTLGGQVLGQCQQISAQVELRLVRHPHGSCHSERQTGLLGEHGVQPGLRSRVGLRPELLQRVRRPRVDVAWQLLRLAVDAESDGRAGDVLDRVLL
ncbi:hypothetical protein [Kitasatospora sp. NPDC085879]|uniref:hypothetical protein n=1 Tax=Kitasatospora sp. NPDC085879 TaxID=3154769 RepID=UPI003425651F